MSRVIAIVGLGLIGGSLAKAISKYTDNKVWGIDNNPPVIDEALECNAIDRAIKPDELNNADIIFLCLYPDECVDFIIKNAAYLRKDAIVTDVCGVKASVVEKILPIAKEYGFEYLPGHPMAGKEKGGFYNSDSQLFKGASYIFTPCSCSQNTVNLLKTLALEIGFGRITITTPKEHDQMIAFTSQIPHILACAYMFSPRSEKHYGYSAGSYRDISRVADINENLWTQAFIQNRECLVKETDELIENLTILRDAVNNKDYLNLKALLKKGGDLKRRLG